MQNFDFRLPSVEPYTSIEIRPPHNLPLSIDRFDENIRKCRLKNIWAEMYDIS